MMTAEQLKASILQMAMQGKLVEQRAEEGTGIELLHKIIKSKTDSNLKYSVPENVPFDLPDSWVWVKHNFLFQISGGSQPPKSKFSSENKEGYVRLYQIRDYGESPVPIYVDKNSVSKFTKKGDILLARYGGSLGKVFWAEDGAYNVAMAKVIPLFEETLIDKDFIFLYYHTSLYQSVVLNSSRSAQAGFNKSDLETMCFPIPPLEEQKRIVAKIEELMPFVEQYAKASTRLNALNASFPDQMKKSILQQAVMGKLVPQDPNDEPASVLLKKIAEEKLKLIKEGKIKKQKALPTITEDEIPFDIPESWEFVRLGEVIELLSGIDFKPSDYSDISGKTVYITGASCLSDTGVIEQRWTDTPKNIAYRGDLLLVCKGSGYGKTVICDVDEAHIARQIMAIKKIGDLNLSYIKYFLQSKIFEIKRNGQGVIPGIDRGSVLNMILPLPPLEEQQRIVDQIDRLNDYVE